MSPRSASIWLAMSSLAARAPRRAPSPSWSCAFPSGGSARAAAGAGPPRDGAPRCRRTGPARSRARRSGGKTAARGPRRRGSASVFAAVEDVAAAVLGPCGLVVAVGLRLLLAQAHRLDLGVAGAEQHHQLVHAGGGSLAEADVVLAAAALVGVALDQDLRRGILAQVLGMCFDQAAVLVLDVELVQVVVDRALRERSGLEPWIGAGDRAGLVDVDLRDRPGLRARARLLGGVGDRGAAGVGAFGVGGAAAGDQGCDGDCDEDRAVVRAHGVSFLHGVSVIR